MVLQTALIAFHEPTSPDEEKRVPVKPYED
jgi:hypothetical protein